MNEAKPFVIDKRLVWEAYHKVRENKGSAGIDKVDQKTFISTDSHTRTYLQGRFLRLSSR